LSDLIQAETPYRRCADVSQANGEDPIGTAPPADLFLVLEHPLPWDRKVERSRGFPRPVAEAVERAQAAGRRVRLLAVAPDRARSRPGWTRLLAFRRPDGPVARFARQEFLAPDQQVVPLATALLEQSGGLSRFAPFRIDEPGVRDLLVCTHGTRDACCATDGFPAYVALRRLARRPAAGRLRVWRCSHLGGHRFAPTLLDLPEGRMWGHLDDHALEILALRTAPPASLRRCYRGWSALDDPFQQAAEREILVDEGWCWTATAARGRTLPVADGRAEVRIEAHGPDNRPPAIYAATIDGNGRVDTLGSSGTDELETVPQYRVTSPVTSHRMTLLLPVVDESVSLAPRPLGVGRGEPTGRRGS